MARVKKVYNRATGKHQKKAKRLDTTAWWNNKFSKASLGKVRKKAIDKVIKKASKGK